MQEPVKLGCIFGCRDEPDRLGHYLQCHIFWSMFNEVFVGMIDPQSFGKVNYLNPSPRKVIIISCAFEVYHALKIGLRYKVDNAFASRRFSEIYRISHKLILEKYGGVKGKLASVPISECSTDSDMTTAQRSWPSFPFQARCG